MDFNADLFAIQDILRNAITTTGEFTRINNKGGNEEKIKNVMMEIHKFISSKNYMINGQINNKYDKQLEDIVLFLAINTAYKAPLDLKEYGHLINIMPQLSKCLLVNIVYGLDLCKCYCKVIEILPISYSIELLEETIPCLKKSVPKIRLCYAIMFLKTAANKLILTDKSKEEQDNVDKLSTVTNIILQSLTGLHLNQAENWSSVQIYQHMGYCLLRLLELLLHCDKNHLNLQKFINNVLRTCCSLVKNITVNVFCSWAEIEEDDQPLQNVVSEKAYLVVEEYQKYDEAKELLSMLRSMARKPKTLAERIQEADISTIIKNIEKEDKDQKSWFQALLNTRLFENKDAFKCVNKWAHLCDEDDVMRILNLNFQSNNKDANALAIKCASMLSLEKIILVTMKYYYKHKFKYVLNEDVGPQLTFIFNRAINTDEKDNAFIKEISLLLLQNPGPVFSYIYSECLKNPFYTNYLHDTFSRIKQLARVDNVGVTVFRDIVMEIKPSSENVENYIAVFRTLQETDYFTSHTICMLLCDALQRGYENRCAEDINCILQIIQGNAIKVPVKEENRPIIDLLLNVMNDFRCILLEFDNIKQQNVKYAVDIIMKLCEINPNYNFKVKAQMRAEDDFTIYYMKYLSSETDLSLLRYFCPDFNMNNYAKCVVDLLRILPRCVTCEWLSICDEIFEEFGSEKTVELLADVLILLCQTMQTQESKEGSGQLFTALKYCMQHFGMFIQRIQENSTLDVEVNTTKQSCRLLRYIPNTLKEEEGLSLINILSERSLKSLASNREFLCLLISINNKMLCQVLAQKMTL